MQFYHKCEKTVTGTLCSGIVVHYGQNTQLVFWAKPNVPFAGWLKLFLKNVRWKKIKNIGSARCVGLLDVPL